MLVAALLFSCKLAKGVMSYSAVMARHAQGAATLTGHTGEALPSGEVVDRHRIKAYLLTT